MFQAERPLTDALTHLQSALDEVITAVDDAELTRVNGEGLLEFLRGVESVRNRLSVLDTAAVLDCDRRGIAYAHKDRGTAGFLARTLKVSTGEARRRVRTAYATTERVGVSGTPIDPVRPVLAAALSTGEVNPDQANVIIRALDGLDRVPDIAPADLEDAERVLVGHCAAFGPADLLVISRRITAHLFPDGTLGADAIARDRRYLSLTPLPDGGAEVTGRLTAGTYAQLFTVLSPLAAPQPGDGDDAGTRDERTAGQRMHDALEALCGRFLRSGTLPDSGGTPCTLMVTASLADLQTGLGHATTSVGPISIPELLTLAVEADIIPVWMNPAGGIMGYGRSRRLFTPAQTTAMTARDRGCSFPTCTAPPEWCQRHHITAWINDGPTDIDNGTLVCSYHHHQALADGWTCHLTNTGIPTWLPPPWIDPHQQPRTNPRITQPLLR